MMSKEITILLHEIAEDGYPVVMEEMTGRVALIFDGCVVSGWPIKHELDDDGRHLWEADSDVGRSAKFAGVTRWIEFPAPVWSLADQGKPQISDAMIQRLREAFAAQLGSAYYPTIEQATAVLEAALGGES